MSSVISDPNEIRDTLAEDHDRNEAANLYRSPDGLFFEVSRKLQCGTVVTDSGLWLAPEEFADCERYV